MGAIKYFLLFLERCCLPVSKVVVHFVNFCIDYTGRLAELVKGLLLAAFYGVLFFEAFYTWTLFAQLSFRLGEPLCYLVPVLWIGMHAYAILVLLTAWIYDDDKHFFEEIRAEMQKQSTSKKKK